MTSPAIIATTHEGKEALVGRYSDEFVRTAEGWKISSIRFLEEGIYKQIDVTSQPPAELS